MGLHNNDIIKLIILECLMLSTSSKARKLQWNSVNTMATHALWLMFSSHQPPWYWLYNINSSLYPVRKGSLIARFMGPTCGTAGADRTHVGPILAPMNFAICVLTIWKAVQVHNNFISFYLVHFYCMISYYLPVIGNALHKPNRLSINLKLELGEPKELVWSVS